MNNQHAHDLIDHNHQIFFFIFGNAWNYLAPIRFFFCFVKRNLYILFVATSWCCWWWINFCFCCCLFVWLKNILHVYLWNTNLLKILKRKWKNWKRERLERLVNTTIGIWRIKRESWKVKCMYQGGVGICVGIPMCGVGIYVCVFGKTCSSPAQVLFVWRKRGEFIDEWLAWVEIGCVCLK